MNRTPRLRRVSASAACVLALTAFTACSDDGGERDGDAGEPSSDASEDADDPGGVPSVRVDDSDDFADQTYVALGDSYTAAPGVDPVEEASGACERSEVNYPKLVAGAYGGSTLIDVSCSGATIADLLDGQSLSGGEATEPQVDSITAETDVVTISIGGNDIGALALLGGGCGVDGCENLDIPAIQAGLQQISTDLADLIEQVGARAPEARVLVIGYPQIAPEGEGCDAVPLEDDELTLAALLNSELVNAQRTGAENAGAEFVDLTEATSGHALCSDDPWINDGDFDGAAPFHPFEAEQRAAAAEIIDTLDG